MMILDSLKDKWAELRLRMPNLSPKTAGGIAAVIILVLLLYYPVGMIIVHNVDDDTTLTVEVQPGQSRTIAIAQALIVREVRTHRWTAMDPFFLPGAALDNMPNFQQGIMGALSRFAVEMSDQIGRVRGSSQVDDDLDKAVGFLKYKGDVWVYDLSESLLPQRSSAQQYGLGADAFGRYNQRLGDGNAVFERRADNLLTTLDRFSADLGSASAVLDGAVADLSTLSFSTDDIFYRTKGRLYAYYLLMREMHHDFANVIEEKKLSPAWDQAVISLRQAAQMDPLIVLNASPDSFIGPSHLTAQGFYLLRARTQIREISNVLYK